MNMFLGLAITAALTAQTAASCSEQPGKDITENNIGNEGGKRRGECCGLCKTRAGCKAYAWSNYNGGTCWFKSATSPTENKPAVYVGIVDDSPSSGSCTKQWNKDIDGGAGLAPVHGRAESQCCAECKSKPGCKAYAHNSYSGGTCWLKTSTGPVINEPGVSIGIVGGGPTPGPITGDHVFTIENRCSFMVWPGAQGSTLVKRGGWEMAPGSTTSFSVPRKFSASRFWGRTGCKYNGGRLWCETGDCGGKLRCDGAGGSPPVTLAEFTLDGDAGKDFYDLSLVDGYNLPMRIETRGSRDAPRGAYFCTNPGCTADLLNTCPAAMQVRKSGRVVSCKSACEAFNGDRYCCRGAFGQPHTCNPETWPTNYARIFKDACPGAYSYAYDDVTSTFTCKGANTGYKIIFCP